MSPPTTPTTDEPDDARWLTRAAFQARFGIGQKLQRKLEGQGRLVALRLGHRTVRLDAASFDRLAAPIETPAAGGAARQA